MTERTLQLASSKSGQSHPLASGGQLTGSADSCAPVTGLPVSLHLYQPPSLTPAASQSDSCSLPVRLLQSPSPTPASLSVRLPQSPSLTPAASQSDSGSLPVLLLQSPSPTPTVSQSDFCSHSVSLLQSLNLTPAASQSQSESQSGVRSPESGRLSRRQQRPGRPGGTVPLIASAPLRWPTVPGRHVFRLPAGTEDGSPTGATPGRDASRT